MLTIRTAAGDETILDQPETPAHIFALRAFEYRLWGTPKPRQQQPPVASEPGERSSQPGSQDVSPSKRNGILMTPGTATLKRSKSVTFGAQVKDKQGATSLKAGKSGLPDTCPGKFPSPFTPKVEGVESDPVCDTARRRTRLTRSLYSIRSDQKPSKTGNVELQRATATVDRVEPQKAPDASDWQQLYEQYAASTKKEMKKLVLKQRAAKSYAKQKDVEALRLAEQVRVQQKKMVQLETTVAELSAQIENYKKQLQEERRADIHDIVAIKSPMRRSTGRSAIDRMQKSPEKVLSRDTAQTRKATTDVKAETLGRSTATTRERRPAPTGDIWAAAIMSSPLIANVPDRPSARRRLEPAEEQSIAPSALTPKNLNLPYREATNRSSRRAPQTPDASNLAFEDLLNLPEPSPQALSERRSTKKRGVGMERSPDRSVFEYHSEHIVVSPAKLHLINDNTSPSPKPRPQTQQDKENTQPAFATSVTPKSTKRPSIAHPFPLQAKECDLLGDAEGKERMMDDDRAARAKARIEARRLEKARQAKA